MNKSVSVGLFSQNFDDLCPADLKDRPFSCQDDFFSEASIIMQCIGIKHIKPIYLNFSSGLMNIDIFPFLFVVRNEIVNLSISTPLSISGYHFITKGVAEGDDDLGNISFHPDILLKPLQWNTWLVTICGLLLCFALIGMAEKLNNNSSKVKVIALGVLQFVTESCFGAVIMGLYVSHLMAIVNVKPKAKLSFTDIDELTKLVANGEKTLVVESFQDIFVWSVLSGKIKINDEYPISLQSLYNATQNNPSLEIPQIEKICEQLTLNTNLVYVGRLSDVEQFCSQYCFYNVPIPNVPLVFRSYIVGMANPLLEPLNLCVDFMRRYTSTKVRRTKKWAVTTCKNEMQSNFINLQTIISAVCILAMGLGFGTCVLFGEIYFKISNKAGKYKLRIK